MLERDGRRVALESAPGPIVVKNNALSLPVLPLVVSTGSGLKAPLLLSGQVAKPLIAPELDLTLSVGPLDLDRLSEGMPQVTRAKGSLSASLHIQGPPSALRVLILGSP